MEGLLVEHKKPYATADIEGLLIFSINVLGRIYDHGHLLSSVQLIFNLSYLTIDKVTKSTIF